MSGQDMAAGAQKAMEECALDVTAGASQQQQARPLEAAEDLLCPICMNDIEKAAYVAFCLHRFCLECIQQWAERKATCPICRRPFHRLLHSVRADDDYQEYVVVSSTRRRRDVARERDRSRSPHRQSSPHNSPLTTALQHPEGGLWDVTQHPEKMPFGGPPTPPPSRLPHPALLGSQPG
nr:E3 ubiquitin-protein ligase Topors-like [Anser cygnoides]